MFKECFWEEEPEYIDFGERQRALKQSLDEEIGEERRLYEQCKRNREPFEWNCYNDESVA